MTSEKRSLRPFIFALGLSVIAASLQLGIFLSPWGKRVEVSSTDFWFNLHYRNESKILSPVNIAILAMDDVSYQLLGVPFDKPWPRELHAKMLRNLKNLGARRVVFDIIFLGAGASLEADLQLERAIASMPTVIGADTGFLKQGKGSGSYSLERLLEPYEPFAKAAEKVGLTKMPAEDGIVRHFILPRTALTQNLPQLYHAAVGVPHNAEWLPSERDLIWYYGPPGSIATYPYHTVILDADRTPPDRFKDKIVFVGLYLRTGLGPTQKDMFLTPLRDQQMFGVEIQATAAANLMQEKWIHRLPKEAEVALLFFAAFMLSLLIIRLRPQWGLCLLFITALAWALLAYSAFLMHYFLPGLLLVTLVLPSVYMLSTLAYYIVTLRAQQQVERAFQLYLPPQMAKRMRYSPQALKQGGEETWATALFTDIQGFTDVAETMKAPDVANMLNAYFDHLVKVVFDHQGTLIKFVGDAVFVIFGAPIPLPNHPLLGAECAINMHREVSAFNKNGAFPPLPTRVGVHTGRMLVGNLGAVNRFDYTAIGDTINLASRLEGLNKYFGTYVMVSESVVSDLRNSFNPFQLGAVQVVGRKEAVKVYTFFEQEISSFVSSAWREALDAFSLKDWNKAEDAFRFVEGKEDLLKKAARLFISEISRLKEQGLPQDWSGGLRFFQK